MSIDGTRANSSNTMSFLDSYLGEPCHSQIRQEMALRELEAKMALAVTDPQEKVYDEELALAEKSIEIKPGTRVLIYSEPRREMVDHFTLGKKAIAIAKNLGADVDADNIVATLQWPTERSYTLNKPGTVKQLDNIMISALLKLMSQLLLIQVPNITSWEELKCKLHTSLHFAPVAANQTSWPYHTQPRIFDVYDNDLPKWLVALALTAVIQETDLHDLFPNAQRALEQVKSIKPEIHDLLKERTEYSSLQILAELVGIVVKPNLTTAGILLKYA